MSEWLAKVEVSNVRVLIFGGVMFNLGSQLALWVVVR